MWLPGLTQNPRLTQNPPPNYARHEYYEELAREKQASRLLLLEQERLRLGIFFDDYEDIMPPTLREMVEDELADLERRIHDIKDELGYW